VDCPPLFPINDALLVGKHITSCVFVSAFGKTRVPLIKTVTKRLLTSGVKMLGMVVNMAKSGGLAYSDNSYEQYNYHYGPETPEKK
jgi:Mrp family chromosome partitioning ATPase